METYRLKNIAIVILLLLNACLLFMVGQQYFQSLQTQRRSAAQLRELYRSSQLALDSRLDLSQQPLDILTLRGRRRQSGPLPLPCWAARPWPPARAAVFTAMRHMTAPSSSGRAAAFMAAAWTCRWRMPPPSPGPSAIGLVMRSPVSDWKGGPAALWPDSWPGTYPSLTAR